jgi:hypothetical protein
VSPILEIRRTELHPHGTMDDSGRELLTADDNVLSYDLIGEE